VTMTKNQWLKAGATAGVAVVAGLAAAQSYNHIYDVALTHHQGPDSVIYPPVIDGLIVVATFVLLLPHTDRWLTALSYGALAFGIGATGFANVFYGLPYGKLTAGISLLPAVAFVLGFEILVRMYRKRDHGGPPPGQDAAPDPFEATRRAYRMSVAAGDPLSQRALAGQHGISRRQARRITTETAVESNGHTVDA
jgi:hypothetical protein